MRRTVLLLSLSLILCFCACNRTTPAASRGGGSGGSAALAFSTVDADGAAWTEACFADAKLTMLNYWAYWCPPCVGELPDLQRLSEDYADRGFRLVGITDEGDLELSAAKMQELGVTYPCLVNAPGLQEALYSGYVPTTVFVDGKGKILGEAYVGSRSYADWAKIIEGYLG